MRDFFSAHARLNCLHIETRARGSIFFMSPITSDKGGTLVPKQVDG